MDVKHKYVPQIILVLKAKPKSVANTKTPVITNVIMVNNNFFLAKFIYLFFLFFMSTNTIHLQLK